MARPSTSIHPLTPMELELWRKLRQLDDAEDPVAFSRRRLGFNPWPRQAEVMRALTRRRRVAVRSGHKVGKSSLASAVALWWWSTKPGARVVLTAPTGRSVREIVWRELTAMYNRSKSHLGGQLHETPSAGLVADDGRQVIGFATDTGESFSGISGANVLYVVDEASGVDEQIFETIEGNRAGGASLLMLGNPTQTSGTFYRAFNEARAGWDAHRISSVEAAQHQVDHGEIPGLATMEWVDEKRADGWEGTPLWDVRVAGDFPAEGPDVVIGLKLVQAARERLEAARVALARLDRLPRLRVGVDVARFGDDESAVAYVRGAVLEPLESFRGLDGQELAARVVAGVRSRRTAGEPKALVKVDVIGVGAACYDALAHWPDLDDEVELIAVNVGEGATREPPPGEPGFNRLRDQVWFGARAWLLAGGALPDDPKLEADLVAPRYGFAVESGRLKVEGKDEIKKRLKRSPDRGDAVCLAVYDPPVEQSVAASWASADTSTW